MRDRYVRSARNLVIKVGTSVLTKGGRFDRARIGKLAAQITPFLKRGVRVSLVSSGAIGAGMTILGMKKRPTAMEELQGAAAVGQRFLMQCYEEAFSKRGRSTAQLLLTWDDVAEEKRFTNARHTLKAIQKWGLVPVVNENDTVATDEIRFGDNDTLSSLLAILVEADALVILSDTDGLYAGGEKGDTKRRFSDVVKIDEAIFSHVRDGKSTFTVGGMSAKLRAIQKCTTSGIPVILADGRRDDVFLRLLRGEEVGTLFRPEKTKRTGRAWIRQLRRHTIR